MLRRLVVGLLAALTGCTSKEISFIDITPYNPSCPDRFSDAGSYCPTSSCPFVGTWQNFAIDGERCGQGAIKLDATGAVSRLTSSGWEPAGFFVSCAGLARGQAFEDLLASRLSGTNCGPACEVTISRADGGTCFLQADVPCPPTPINPSALPVTVYVYSCVP
jgi:hypothetical protein